jgi:hypothetical protein
MVRSLLQRKMVESDTAHCSVRPLSAYTQQHIARINAIDNVGAQNCGAHEILQSKNINMRGISSLSIVFRFELDSYYLQSVWKILRGPVQFNFARLACVLIRELWD